jgi:hypothetical protein
MSDARMYETHDRVPKTAEWICPDRRNLLSSCPWDHSLVTRRPPKPEQADCMRRPQTPSNQATAGSRPPADHALRSLARAARRDSAVILHAGVTPQAGLWGPRRWMMLREGILFSSCNHQKYALVPVLPLPCSSPSGCARPREQCPQPQEFLNQFSFPKLQAPIPSGYRPKLVPARQTVNITPRPSPYDVNRSLNRNCTLGASTIFHCSPSSFSS